MYLPGPGFEPTSSEFLDKFLATRPVADKDKFGGIVYLVQIIYPLTFLFYK